MTPAPLNRRRLLGTGAAALAAAAVPMGLARPARAASDVVLGAV
jgi:nitrous oxide reductase